MAHTTAMVRVLIEATQKVRYSRYVSVPVSVAASYDAAVERQERDPWFARFADEHIDVSNDITDADDFEDVIMTRSPKAQAPC